MANLATINNNLLADSGIDPISVVTGSGVTNRITYWSGASTIGYLDTASYPSLTELSYVKGVTSSIQTQLDAKAPENAAFTDANLLDQGGFFTGFNPSNIPSGQTSGDWGVLNAPLWSNYYSGERYNIQFAANLDNNANVFVRKFLYFGSVLQSVWYTLLHSGNYNSYALPLTGGTLSGPLTLSYTNARLTIIDGTNRLDLGQWDGINNRIESNGRPLYMVSYGGTVSIGRSSGTNLVIDTSTLTYGNANITSAGNINGVGLNISGVSSLAGVVKHTGYEYKVYENLCGIDNYYGSAGAFAINTNIPWDAGNMLTIEVKGYDYNDGRNFTATFSCYAGEGTFFATGYTTNADDVFAKTYAFYRNASNRVVLVLGSIAGNYQYQLWVSEFKQGYSNLTSSYADGWTITKITSTTGLSNGTAISNKTYTGGVFNGGSVTGTSAYFSSTLQAASGSVFTGTGVGVMNSILKLASTTTADSLIEFNNTANSFCFGFSSTGVKGQRFVFINGAPTEVAYITAAGAAVFSSSVTGSSIIKTGGTSSQYLMADGSVSTLTNPVTGTGTINYIPKFTATGSTIGNSNIVLSSGANFVEMTIGSTSGATNNYNTLNILAVTEPRIYLTASDGFNSVLYNSYGDIALQAQFSSPSVNNNIFYYNGSSSTNRSLTFQTEGSNRITINQVGSIRLNAYGSGTFTGTVAYNLAVDSSGNIIEVTDGGGTVTGTGVTNRLTYWSGTSTIGYLDTASYPSLTEISYVKGVTSAIQTQLNSLAPNNASFGDANAPTTGGFFAGYNPTNIPAGQSGGDWGLLSAPMWPSNSATERYTFQFASNLDNNANIFVRKFRYNAGVLQSTWYTLLNSGNYGSYALPLSGGTLTGLLTSTISSGNNIILNKGTGPSIEFNKTNATAQSWQISTDPNFRIYNGTLTSDALVFSASNNAATFSSSVSASALISSSLNISGETYLSTVKYNQSPYRVYRNLARIDNYNAGVGALAITTNITWNAANMLTIQVKGYRYGNTPFDITVGCYAGEGQFYASGYITNSDGIFNGQLYFYKNASNKVVLVLGDPTSAYPIQLWVSEFKQGFNGQDPAFADGWTITRITSLTGLTNGVTIPNASVTGGIFNGVSVTTSSSIYSGSSITAVSEIFSFKNRAYNGYISLTTGSSTIMLPQLNGKTENSDIGMYFTLERASNIDTITGFNLTAWRFTTNFTLESGDLIQFQNNYVNKFRVDYAGAGTFASSVTASSIIKSGGTSSQFLKADGSIDSNTYVTGGPYLPLSGGTLTGTLNGTIASFSSTGSGVFNSIIKAVNTTTADSLIEFSNTANGFCFGFSSTGARGQRFVFINGAPTEIGYITAGGDAVFTSFVKTGGTSAQYLKADGSVSTLTNPVTGTGVTNRIAYWDSASSISYLDTASYPSLTELSYVKGVTSAIQTQLNTKAPNNATFTDANTLTTGGFFTGFNATNVPSGLSSLDMGLCNMPLWGGNSAGERYTMQMFANLDTNTNFYIRKFKFFGSVSQSTWYILLHSGNYNSYALPLTGGTLTGDLTVSGASRRITISDGTNGLTTGLWDGANVRLEGAGRPMYMVSYGGTISIGRSSGNNLVIDTTTVTYGSCSMSSAGQFTGSNLDISNNSLLNKVKYTQYGYRVYRNLARFDNYNNGTGAIAVYTNIPWDAANMLTIQLKGFRYGDRPFDITVACYAGEGNFYSPGYFSNSANAIFPSYTWYRDGNNKIVLVLGSTSGSYGVQIWAAEYKQGFGNQDPAYADGWSIGKITTTTGLSTGVSIPEKTYTGGTFYGDSVTTSSTIYSGSTITAVSDIYSFKNRVNNGHISLTTGSSGAMLPQLDARTESSAIGMYFNMSRAGNIGSITGFSVTAWRYTTDFTLTSGDLIQFQNNYSDRFKVNYNGAGTFNSSVTASGFFESSDSRIKTLLENTIDYNLVSNVEAMFYEKNGVKELGYFAQDFEEILSSAVYKDENGFLNLSYTQVHTAKIAALEARVKELESQLKNK